MNKIKFALPLVLIFSHLCADRSFTMVPPSYTRATWNLSDYQSVLKSHPPPFQNESHLQTKNHRTWSFGRTEPRPPRRQTGYKEKRRYSAAICDFATAYQKSHGSPAATRYARTPAHPHTRVDGRIRFRTCCSLEHAVMKAVLRALHPRALPDFSE